MEKIKLEIKTLNGDIIHTIEPEIFNVDKPLMFVLTTETEEKGVIICKEPTDMKFLRLTQTKKKLVLS